MTLQWQPKLVNYHGMQYIPPPPPPGGITVTISFCCLKDLLMLHPSTALLDKLCFLVGADSKVCDLHLRLC